MHFISARNIALAVAGLLIVAAVGHEIYVRSHAPAAQPISTATSTPPYELVTPDYHQPINFSPDIASNIRADLNNNLAQVQAKITANPLDLDAWESLGAIYKVGGDYPHAITAWTYITEVSPSSPEPYFDLGDLYMNFLKDYPKAEANYKKVIALRPHTIAAYQNLYTLYRSLYKTNTSAASDILVEGLKNNPGNQQLLDLQAELKSAK